MPAVRLYILLSVCLAMASGVVHKIQTQHHALSLEHSRHLFGHASLRHQQLYRRKVGMQAGVGKLPLDEDRYLITGVITVGTPPQSFNVEVDAFFDNDLTLIDPNATMNYDNKYIPKKNTYNANNSSTYVAVNGNISSWGLKAHKAQDVLNIGSLSATIKSFVVVDNVAYVLNDEPIDGILGLSPMKKSNLNVSVVADDLIDQLDKPLISVFVNATMLDNVLGNGTGQVTLGAEDTDNCQSTWSYVPALDNYTNSAVCQNTICSPFTVHASSAEVTIGGQLTTVNLDSNVTFYPWPSFAVPVSVREVILNATGATYNKTVGLYTINCTKTIFCTTNCTTKPAPITLNIGGVGNSTDSTSRKLVLSDVDYIRYKNWKREGVCYLGMNFYSTINNQWHLGSQVLNNHCISFNYKERTIGFADTKTPNPISQKPKN